MELHQSTFLIILNRMIPHFGVIGAIFALTKKSARSGSNPKTSQPYLLSLKASSYSAYMILLCIRCIVIECSCNVNFGRCIQVRCSGGIPLPPDAINYDAACILCDAADVLSIASSIWTYVLYIHWSGLSLRSNSKIIVVLDMCNLYMVIICHFEVSFKWWIESIKLVTFVVIIYIWSVKLVGISESRGLYIKIRI